MFGRNRVVITGVGVLAANGIGKDAFWNSLLAGESGIGPITQFDASELPWRIAGEIPDFVPEQYIEKHFKPKRQSRNTQIAAAATQLALTDADLDRARLSRTQPLPIVVGISLGGLDLVEQHTRRLIERGITKGLPTVSACVHVIAPSFISSILGVETRINVISNSCAGGLDAIADAAELIRKGVHDVALAGGTDAVIIPSVVTGLGYAGMLSTENDHPSTVSRPFDLKRSGGIISEGSGMLVLESLEHALVRGATPYAEIIGYGSANNVNSSPSTGLESAMNQALSNAGIMPSEIDHINAHGSSDIHLDIAETRAIRAVFKNSTDQISVTSVKGATGNPLSAGGPIQTIAAAMTLLNGTIPHITNYTSPDPSCDLNFVTKNNLMNNTNYTLINSHGTGGVNSSLLLKKFP
ncbi:beta-ketoacyl-[acyl-carrier-protein] synthase family protein [Pontiellaceae bacterium B12219]|nr:beta-ketoacyl-[acyl-carrier-protein] synthase family protein [Pontiellaceae bacterium B12219]